MIHAAIVAGIAPDRQPDLAELGSLAEAAGADIVGSVTQRRQPVPGTVFGSGTLGEIATLVSDTGADTVVVDGRLSPGETLAIEDEVGARAIDRHRLVLEIFAERARTRRAKVQVRLARLKYELPRIERSGDPSRLNLLLETGTRYHDVKRRISRLERELADHPPVAESTIRRRREAGFDLVAIVGYTNAGKSTLLRRLADDMAVDDGGHPDLTATAATEDRLFKTLETTTRRATLDGRPVLMTDTVGFLDDLPHWLVSSFRGTLEVASMADVVVLVVAADQPLAELRRKVDTSLETLGEDRPPIVPALNKVDAVAAGELDRSTCYLESQIALSVPISARDGAGTAALTTAILDRLPDLDTVTFELPMNDDAMSVLSRMYEEAPEVDVRYGNRTMSVTASAKSETLDRFEAEVASLRADLD